MVKRKGMDESKDFCWSLSRTYAEKLLNCYCELYGK